MTGDGMRPTFRDELQRIDRLLTLVHARDIAPVRGVLTYHDLLVVTCRSLADLGEWLESDPGFLPRDWNVVRCDVKREASLRTCASIASGRIGLILTRPPVRGGAASARRHPGEPPAVQYYVDASDPADPYGGAEVDALLEDARAAWHGIVNRHWMDGLFGRNEL